MSHSGLKSKEGHVNINTLRDGTWKSVWRMDRKQWELSVILESLKRFFEVQIEENQFLPTLSG